MRLGTLRRLNQHLTRAIAPAVSRFSNILAMLALQPATLTKLLGQMLGHVDVYKKNIKKIQRLITKISRSIFREAGLDP